MIVLSDVQMPTEGVRLIQPQVEAFFDTQSAGDGSLCVSEGSVTWISRQSQKGISLTYPSIILHAISRDLSTFPKEHIYILVDCSKADLNMQEEQMDGDELDDADSEDSPNVQIRLVPTDMSCLQQIYEQMVECQELNPDEEDIQSDQEDEEDNTEENGGHSDGQWFTAENMGANFQLSEEGMANLHRMMGGDHPNNGHNGDDEEMDDS